MHKVFLPRRCPPVMPRVLPFLHEGFVSTEPVCLRSSSLGSTAISSGHCIHRVTIQRHGSSLLSHSAPNLSLIGSSNAGPLIAGHLQLDATLSESPFVEAPSIENAVPQPCEQVILICGRTARMPQREQNGCDVNSLPPYLRVCAPIPRACLDSRASIPTPIPEKLQAYLDWAAYVERVGIDDSLRHLNPHLRTPQLFSSRVRVVPSTVYLRYRYPV